MTDFDAYIFDMDGTLWDAVDSYCAVWNETYRQLGLDIEPVTYTRLRGLMGTPLTGIYDVLVGDRADRDSFNKALRDNEARMMPVLGGKVYPGADTLAALRAEGRQLFMVSNCSPSGLDNFLNFTGMRGLMTDWLSFGMNGKEKDENIRIIIERYNLNRALYVGDTQDDCNWTHKAGATFAWASYGFGKDVRGADYVLKSLSDLRDL